MKLPFLTVLLLACLLVQCKKDTATNDNGTTSTALAVATITASDSLRQAYTQHLAALTPKFPDRCQTKGSQLFPCDEAPKDTLLFCTREHLKHIVESRDVFALLDYVSPDVKVGFGDENGLQAFIHQWKLDDMDNNKSAEIWPVLGRVLQLGGAFHEGKTTFEAPYVSVCWPSEFDPFEHGTIIGEGVRLRAGPSQQDQIVATISHEVVKLLSFTETPVTIGTATHPWVKVKTQAGQEGYVFGQFWYSPVDYRMVMQKTGDGQWRITSLLAGD